MIDHCAMMSCGMSEQPLWLFLDQTRRNQLGVLVRRAAKYAQGCNLQRVNCSTPWQCSRMGEHGVLNVKSNLFSCADRENLKTITRHFACNLDKQSTHRVLNSIFSWMLRVNTFWRERKILCEVASMQRSCCTRCCFTVLLNFLEHTVAAVRTQARSCIAQSAQKNHLDLTNLR